MAEPDDRVLHLAGIRKSYGSGEVESEILHGIDLTLRRGEFAALIGPSGSGKSTLLNLIGLLDRPTNGQLHIDGEDSGQLDDTGLTRLRGQRIGFVFQHHHLIPAFTAEENVAMPLLVARGRPDAEMFARAGRLLDQVGLADRKQHLANRLSGGQQQRVAIARALVTNPSLVLADEPTGNLDTHSADDVFALLREFNRRQHTTFLIVTHDPRLAARCDRIIELVDGRIVADQAVDDEETTRALLLDDRHKFSSVKVPPFFSNLLPEGGLRKSIAQRLKIHEDREFPLLSALGEDLPGAVILTPAETPGHLMRRRGAVAGGPSADDLKELKFSLGGMQMKFSMLRQGERFTLSGSKKLGNYIVKPPSHDFEALPKVEAATMETARATGIDVPEVQLLAPERIHGLPNMAEFRQGEPFYAIRRFDRPDGGRIHAEDFAQVFNLRTHHKYGQVNYEMIGRTLLLYASGLPDVKEMARRLVLNVLMGNGDAHIKNWSLIYDNPLRPRLAPAYDLVSTVAYTSHDTSIALNMTGVKLFRNITLDTFASLFTRIGLVDRIREEVMEEVRTTGRRLLETWQRQFQAVDVPENLAMMIKQHQAALPLTKALRGL